ncbi:MAG TPA: hypothetical protein VEK11_02475 [Thermoanaerobaculia bacterium]|nr:hypothetical protein [Thermoanaerobaculia bacterium]
MKRLFFFTAVTAALLFAAGDAQAACQKCLNEFSPNAMCWALTGSQTSEAEYDACWEVPVYDENGQIEGEYCDGSPAPSSCTSSGGGGGGPGGGFNDDPGTCTRTAMGCPAECHTCL